MSNEAAARGTRLTMAMELSNRGGGKTGKKRKIVFREDSRHESGEVGVRRCRWHGDMGEEGRRR